MSGECPDDVCNSFKRLALANFMTHTNKLCCFCGHQFNDLDDVIAKNVVLIKHGETHKDKALVACEVCYKDKVNNVR